MKDQPPIVNLTITNYHYENVEIENKPNENVKKEYEEAVKKLKDKRKEIDLRIEELNKKWVGGKSEIDQL